MVSVGVLSILVIAVVVGIAVFRRTPTDRGPGSGDGEDLLSYLVLAIAVGVGTFSLMNLGRVAFPRDVFIWDPEGQMAGALAGIVVSAPFAVILWRRQRARRDIFPRSGGWTLYLSLIEAVFMTAFALAAFALLSRLIGDGEPVTFTDILVFAGIVIFHEFATRETPPRSGGAELPRIIGSAIGLIMLTMGVTWLLAQLLERVFGFAPNLVGGPSWGTQGALAITGAAIWGYRWLRPWSEAPSPARNAWTFLVATLSIGTFFGALGTIITQVLTFLLTATAPARTHFAILPATLALALVMFAIWFHHRRRLGTERTDPVRAYEYFTAALALGASVGAVTGLVGAVVSRPLIAGDRGQLALIAGTFLLLGLSVWYFYWSRAQAQPPETELAASPRRTYLLGLGVVMGLTGAIAMIVVLVGVFQVLLGVDRLTTQFPALITLVLASGGVAWHLFATYTKNKTATTTGVTIPAFDVTVICSHPGMLATRFPSQARVRVVYRGDDAGVVTDEMADQIVTEVNNRPSFVWVDDTGFRVAPAR